MRILVVQESNWIERGPHQSHHLMERLAERGHEIRVIDFDILWRDKNESRVRSERQVFQGVHKAIDTNRITVIRPSIIRMPVMEYLSLAYSHRKEIWKQVKEFKPDLIVGFGILNACISAHIAKKSRIPFVYYIIDELHRLVPQRTFRPIARVLERHNMASATRVITINEGLREYAIKMNSCEQHTSVIRAGVDLKRFDSNELVRDTIRKKYGFSDKDVVLFFMGWLYDFSGLVEVVKELAKTERKEFEIRLLIIGAGPLWDELHKLKDGFSRKDEVVLIEWMPYDDVCKHISASDICILPSHKNRIMMNIVPIKMYEYMAARKPVIATNLPGLMKEFGHDHGVIYIEKSADTIGKAQELVMTKALKNEGGKARDFVEKNDWSCVVTQFDEVLSNAIRD